MGEGAISSGLGGARIILCAFDSHDHFNGELHFWGIPPPAGPFIMAKNRQGASLADFVRQRGTPPQPTPPLADLLLPKKCAKIGMRANNIIYYLPRSYDCPDESWGRINSYVFVLKNIYGEAKQRVQPYQTIRKWYPATTRMETRVGWFGGFWKKMFWFLWPSRNCEP